MNGRAILPNRVWTLRKIPYWASMRMAALVGLAWVTTPPQVVGEARVFLWGEVHPHYRRRGLGSFLLQLDGGARQANSGRHAGGPASRPAPRDQPRYLRASCHEFLTDRLRLFARHGFSEPVRYSKPHASRSEPAAAGSDVAPWCADGGGGVPEMAVYALDTL